jgi:hypothetical protein
MDIGGAHIEATWSHSRCIACLAEADFSLEHLIPDSLGGKLTCRFVCIDCNSHMGHLFEAKAKADPSIQLLVSKLEPSCPALAMRLSDGQTYVSFGPGGKSAGYVKGGDYFTLSRKVEDGSLIQRTPEAAKSIQRILQRAGGDAESIADSLRRLESAPENTRVALAEGLEVVKWSIERIEPALNGPLLSALLPIKSAYEFLALHLNGAIYEDVPSLSAARVALRGGIVDPTHLLVERLQSPTARLFHGIVFEGNDPYAKVQVRLFGQLAFRIHFFSLAIGGPRYTYTHDLVSNVERVERSLGSNDDG